MKLFPGGGDVATVLFDENQPAGAKVTQIQAADRDSGENGYVSYSIVNLDDAPFEIDQVRTS